MKSNDKANEIKPRQIKDAPFCWQHKETLRMIRDVFENGHGIAAIPISVYVALTELASDAQSETFTAPVSEIARRACVSYRTAFDFLKRFEDVKLIAVKRLSVEGTKERLPSIYTLLSPLMHAVHNPLCKREARRLPRRLKNQKNRKNQKKEEVRTPRRAQTMAKEDLVFEEWGKAEGSHGGNGNLQDNSEIVEGNKGREKQEAPAQRGYLLYEKFVEEKLANQMFAKDDTLPFTPAIKRGEVIEELERPK